MFLVMSHSQWVWAASCHRRHEGALQKTEITTLEITNKNLEIAENWFRSRLTGMEKKFPLSRSFFSSRMEEPESL